MQHGSLVGGAALRRRTTGAHSSRQSDLRLCMKEEEFGAAIERKTPAGGTSSLRDEEDGSQDVFFSLRHAVLHGRND